MLSGAVVLHDRRLRWWAVCGSIHLKKLKHVFCGVSLGGLMEAGGRVDQRLGLNNWLFAGPRVHAPNSLFDAVIVGADFDE